MRTMSSTSAYTSPSSKATKAMPPVLLSSVAKTAEFGNAASAAAIDVSLFQEIPGLAFDSAGRSMPPAP